MKKYCTFILALLCPFYVQSQQAKPTEAEVNFSRWFDTAVGLENTPVAQGSLYLMHPRVSGTHQFFISKLWSHGTIVLDGQHYANIPLVYDVEQHILVMQHTIRQRQHGIALDSEALQAFTLHRHLFKKVEISGTQGFYDHLYQGDSVSLLAKRKKDLIAQKEGVEFEDKDEFYVLTGQQLVPVTNLRSLRRHFPNNRTLFKKIRREQKLRFSKNDEPQMVLFLKAFDLLLTE